MILHKVHNNLLPGFAAIIFLFLVACSSENEFQTLDQWVSLRQGEQLPGSELIEKVKTPDGYFAVFRRGEKVVLIQRILAHETKIGGYSSSLSVDDSDGVNSEVVFDKTNFESSSFYKIGGFLYREKTISLGIDKAFEGKLHISYRWRPIVLGDHASNNTRETAEAIETVTKNAIDPLVIDVETFWISSST